MNDSSTDSRAGCFLETAPKLLIGFRPAIVRPSSYRICRSRLAKSKRQGTLQGSPQTPGVGELRIGTFQEKPQRPCQEKEKKYSRSLFILISHRIFEESQPEATGHSRVYQAASVAAPLWPGIRRASASRFRLRSRSSRHRESAICAVNIRCTNPFMIRSVLNIIQRRRQRYPTRVTLTPPSAKTRIAKPATFRAICRAGP